jgi:hypothetical protein
MTPLMSTLMVFLCAFGGALLGMYLSSVLPEHHLSADSKKLVKTGTALVSTMAALLLSLQLSASRSTFDAEEMQYKQLCAESVLLDRVLAHYGPEAQKSRDLLRNSLVSYLNKVWPQDGPEHFAPPVGSDVLYDKVQDLKPVTDDQREAKIQALGMVIDLGRASWLTLEASRSSTAFLIQVVELSWIMAIFVGFGLFAPRNATVMLTLLVAALTVSGAVFLILEMGGPFDGLIRISDDPLRKALSSLGR